MDASALELTEALAAAEAAAGDDPRARLEGLAHAYRAFATHHPRATALLFADLGADTSLDAEASRRARPRRCWP